MRRPRPFKPFEKPVPGELFVWVKRVSYVELAIFLGLLFFWDRTRLRDRDDDLRHGPTGSASAALCVLIWIACIRHEAPYTLLAATLTPFGPIGSVIGIELIERKGWGIAPAAATPQSATEQT